MRAFLANLIANRDKPLRPNDLRHYTDEEARADRFTEVAGRPNTELSTAELAALRIRVHAQIAQRAQGTRLVKTHNFAGYCEGHSLFNWKTTAGAIYLLRNPLDVVVSMTHHYGLTIDEAIDRLGDDRVVSINDALYVSHVIGSWTTHVSSWAAVADRSPDSVLMLRYEDLLRSPVEHFAKAARLIGVADDEALIVRAVKHAEFRTLAALENSDGFVEAVDGKRRFFRIGSADQWRDGLSRDQIARIVHDHREQMQRFGYIPPGY
jgi:hypothetical protein